MEFFISAFQLCNSVQDHVLCAEFLAEVHQCLHRDHGYVVGTKVQFTIEVDGVPVRNVAVQPDLTIAGTFASYPLSFCLWCMLCALQQ